MCLLLDIYIYIYIGFSPTGKSFRFVRACERASGRGEARRSCVGEREDDFLRWLGVGEGWFRSRGGGGGDVENVSGVVPGLSRGCPGVVPAVVPCFFGGRRKRVRGCPGVVPGLSRPGCPLFFWWSSKTCPGLSRGCPGGCPVVLFLRPCCHC